MRLFLLTFLIFLACFTGGYVLAESSIANVSLPQGRSDSASADIALYTKAISEHPNDYENYYKRGIAYTLLQQYPEALVDFNKVLSLKKTDNATTYNDIGVIFFSLREYGKARDNFHRAIVDSPTFPVSYHNLGHVYAQENLYALAIENYTKAITLSKDFYASAVFYRAEMYRAMGDHRRSLTDYDAVVNHGGAILPVVYVGRGSSYLILGSLDLARADFVHALSMDMNLPSAYTSLGTIDFYQQRYADALSSYAKAIELRSEDTVALLGYADTQSILKNYDDAVVYYTKLITLEPQSVTAYIGRAYAYMQQGLYILAIADYSSVLSFSSSPDVYADRGYLYSVLQNYPLALLDYDKAIALDPNHLSAYNNRGLTYLAMGDNASALQDFDKVLLLDKENVHGYINRGIVALQLSQSAESLPYFDNAIRLAPNMPEVYVNKGIALAILDKPQEAIDAFTKALALDPYNAKAYLNRGLAYVTLGHKDFATRDFDAAVRYDASLQPTIASLSSAMP